MLLKVPTKRKRHVSNVIFKYTSISKTLYHFTILYTTSYICFMLLQLLPSLQILFKNPPTSLFGLVLNQSVRAENLTNSYSESIRKILRISTAKDILLSYKSNRYKIFFCHLNFLINNKQKFHHNEFRKNIIRFLLL